MKKTTVDPARKLFWKTAGLVMLLLAVLLLIALFMWSMALHGAIIDR